MFTRARTAYAVEIVRRFNQDRKRLTELGLSGEFISVDIGLGDSHNNGRTVARVQLADGFVYYKPRPVDADLTLARLVRELNGGHETIGVPRAIACDGYGWSEAITHTYCDTHNEQKQFYYAMGSWCAVMLLVRGSDLHYENVVAHGPIPYVVDCETLFTAPSQITPRIDVAWNLAHEMAGNSVLATGLLPVRLPHPMAPGGVDVSGASALPREQPPGPVPVIEGVGTDELRLVIERRQRPASKNLPVEHPRPDLFWNDLLAGFADYSSRIDDLVATARAETLLEPFTRTGLRHIARATRSYMEFIRALWHPASLSDPDAARAEVAARLTELDDRFPASTVDAEVGLLEQGDVPTFTYDAGSGIVCDPSGAVVLKAGDRIGPALHRWRAKDDDFEHSIIRTSLSLAYSSSQLPQGSHRRKHVDRGPGSLRELAEWSAKVVVDQAFRGDDDSAAWVGPSVDRWTATVSALHADLYSGHDGITVALAAFRYAGQVGLVSAHHEFDDLLAAAIRTLVRLHTDTEQPENAGLGGLGGAIWTWLTLDTLGATPTPFAVEQARTLVCRLRSVVQDSSPVDVMSGTAGVIVPLLGLSSRTGDNEFLDLANDAARHVADNARERDGVAWWPTVLEPSGIGGFAHGATGIGWALARLGLATQNEEWLDLARKAFAFEEMAFDEARGGWRDLRTSVRNSTVPSHWCHGSVGIGMATLDLHTRSTELGTKETLSKAVSSVTAQEPRAEHTMCHGDLGAWELTRRLASHDPEMTTTFETWSARILEDIRSAGVNTGFLSGSLNPGLMTGISGVLYQALSCMPGVTLPSPLLLECIPRLAP